LNRGYIDSLENSLITRGGAIDVSGMGDGTTRVVMRNIRSAGLSAFAEATADRSGPRSAALKDPPSSGATVKSVSLDPDVQDILSLRSRDRERVADVLTREEGLTAALVPHIIPLLAWDPVAEHAVFALRKVAEERVGQ